MSEGDEMAWDSFLDDLYKGRRCVACEVLDGHDPHCEICSGREVT